MLLKRAVQNQVFIVLVLVLLSFLVYFNRCPPRCAPKRRRVVVSPADGKVLFVKNKTIAIFLGVRDVHVQRAPISGRVISIERIRGGIQRRF